MKVVYRFMGFLSALSLASALWAPTLALAQVGGPPGGGPPGGAGNLAARVAELENAVTVLEAAVAELQAGGGAGVSESDDPVSWTGTHTWKTDAGPGSGKTLKTFSTTLPPGLGWATVLSIPVPDNSATLLLAWVGGIDSPGDSGGAGGIVSLSKIGGAVTVGDSNDFPVTGNFLLQVDFVANGDGGVDVQVDHDQATPVKVTGWVEYSSAPK